MTTQAPVADVTSLSGESPGNSNSDKKFLFRSSRPDRERAGLSHMRQDAGCGFGADHNGDGVLEGMDRLSEFEVQESTLLPLRSRIDSVALSPLIAALHQS